MPSLRRIRSGLLSVALAFGATAQAATFSYHVLGDDHGSWPNILESIGLRPAALGPAGVLVAPRGTALPSAGGAEWAERVDRGAILVLEGESPVASSFGFVAGVGRVAVRGVEEVSAPKLEIVWEKAVTIPVFAIPQTARIFARERWQGAPLVAGFRQGRGAVLWVAASPGAQGYERFPYLPQALVALGLDPPFRSSRLWAFFDSSYRLRADPEYLAARWRASGIAALQVAAWHYWETEPERDAYLAKLIEACHRNLIHVYAWFELPHVSEQFWRDHPEWREKTAIGQDAHLDWRKLMNLTNRDAFMSVADGARSLLRRFDWDGVNLAELYFESLEGAANPARFTPMNADVRREFEEQEHFDPIELFRGASPEPARLKAFLDYRAGLARRQQEEWLGVVDGVRRERPELDLVLTHVDDRFDTTMREKIGADAARVLPLLADHSFTFLIEDPATIWHLGPKRYPQIAARYAPLTPHGEKLAIDINIVERYQDVYPTKQQTGTELFQLVREATNAFDRVALYFENSLMPRDLPLLGSAAAGVDRVERSGNKLVISSRHGVGVPWSGPALVDGKLWPIRGSGVVWLPAGLHAIDAGAQDPSLLMEDFGGTIMGAAATATGIQFAYRCDTRALAKLPRRPARIQVDGLPFTLPVSSTLPSGSGFVITLPRGQHLVVIE
ncbi:MAG: hypothetical protein ABI823_05360 [Bryobacteraceae bacterium]